VHPFAPSKLFSLVVQAPICRFRFLLNHVNVILEISWR
jgi:hypothetical protein